MSDEHNVMPAATRDGGLAENGGSSGSTGESPQAQAGSTVTLHYGTNRNMIGDHNDFGPEFGWAPNDRNYYAGIAHFAPTRSLDDAIAGRPAAGGAAITGVKVDPQKMIESFLDEASRVQAASTDPGLQSLVYIHGYAFEFKEVAPIARVVAAGYGSKANLFFSWPSYGSHWRYGDDWDHAYGSGTAVAQFLLDLLAGVAKMAVPPRLSLVCHSMGNRVLSSTIQALDVQTQTKLTRFFDHILLFAADESYTAIDDARKLQPALAMFKKSMTIYTNQFDVPLQLAKDHPKNKSEELGRKGPATFPILESSGAVRKDVFWVDCSEVADNLKPTLGHQYYRVIPAVIQDAAAVLSGAAGATIPGRKPDAAVAQKFLIPKP